MLFIANADAIRNALFATIALLLIMKLAEYLVSNK